MDSIRDIRATSALAGGSGVIFDVVADDRTLDIIENDSGRGNGHAVAAAPDAAARLGD